MKYAIVVLFIIMSIIAQFVMIHNEIAEADKIRYIKTNIIKNKYPIGFMWYNAPASEYIDIRDFNFSIFVSYIKNFLGISFLIFACILVDSIKFMNNCFRIIF
jgi:hypothetical protein